MANPAISWGGPWSTGLLIVEQPLASPPETFTLSGSDNRVNGVGSLSLVSGSVSTRGVSGPNANRGWLNLELGIKKVVVPSISDPGFAAVFGLIALGGCYVLWRRRIQS